MTLGSILRALIVCGATLGPARADDPKPTPPAIPRASNPDAVVAPVVVKVTAATAPANGAELFPNVLADARQALVKGRDYVAHFVRQERVNGTLRPEQSGEIRARATPFSVGVKLLAPKDVAGWETVFVTNKRDDKARFKPAGKAGLRGFRTMATDSAEAMAGTRHPITGVGMMAILDRCEKVIADEKRLRNPVQVTVAEYTFNGRPCQRFDIYADRPHPTRYCHHAVLFVDTATKLPVRYEAYDQPKAGEAVGELIEMVSFVNVKVNAGLGNATFDK